MGVGARLFESGMLGWYRRQGWSVEGDIPHSRRFVIIAAPHTSNWDFFYFIGGTRALGLKASFMGKKQLFAWPFGGLMRDVGGIPVDRTRSTNVVAAMVAEFARREEFMLTIAPEGTRGSVRAWRTGFYQIALGAKVPMVCGLMDYARKVVGLGPAMMPTGDYAADMVAVRRFYANCTPKHPEKGNAALIADSILTV